MEIRVTVDQAKVQEALTKAPGVVERNVDAQLGVLAAKVARDARRNASQLDATGALRDSIKATRLSMLRWQVATGTNYARAVEEGTGLAVGHKAYMPDPKKLEPYVKFRGNVRWARRGSQKRTDQLREIRDRAWALARWIRAHGTKPHPYMAPAVEKNRSGAAEQIALGVAAGLKEAFGA